MKSRRHDVKGLKVNAIVENKNRHWDQSYKHLQHKQNVDRSLNGLTLRTHAQSNWSDSNGNPTSLFIPFFFNDQTVSIQNLTFHRFLQEHGNMLNVTI